jgi:hypothetical protein
MQKLKLMDQIYGLESYVFLILTTLRHRTDFTATEIIDLQSKITAWYVSWIAIIWA